MAKHIHVHFHDIADGALSEIHWHVYAEPDQEERHKSPDTDTQNLHIINPPNNSPWNVRPPVAGSSSPGYICADGNALVGGEPADSVWAFIFDHLPTFTELMTI